ncbi:hypothetical protein [Candidatus Chloroploca asiatica]|nr:hypothetical protein [Candidatus Chloroploca asiatica]
MSAMAGDYLIQLEAAFARAWASVDGQVHSVQVQGVAFELRMADAALEGVVLPALAHLLGEPDAPAEGEAMTFHLWDGATTGVRPPAPPFAPTDYRRYGQRAVLYAGSLALMHAPTSGQLFAYDRSTRQGFWWIDEAAQLSIYERAAPLQTLFHWALAETGWQVIHASALGNEDGGVLLIGNSGAGKSSTALSCLAYPALRLLSDDKCLVRVEPEPRAAMLFNSAKLKVDMLDRLSYLRPLLDRWDDVYKASKGLAFLYPTYAAQMVASFPIKALLLPEVTHRAEARLRLAAPGELFRQLGPSTVIWLPGAEAESYRLSAELTRRLPCYRLELASDPGKNVAAIAALLAEHQDTLL